MKIPKNLRKAIRDRLMADDRPMSSATIAEVVNPVVAQAHRKTPKQMAFVLKQMKRDGDVIIAKETKNGLTPSGNTRVRVEWSLNHEVADPDIITEDD